MYFVYLFSSHSEYALEAPGVFPQARGKPEKIMLARLNKKMRDAATKTVVPISKFGFKNTFCVGDVNRYHTLAAMVTSLPNLQQIEIWNLEYYSGPIVNVYYDGEDPEYEIPTHDLDLAPHDIGILSSFVKLRELTIEGAPLNGRYPTLFNFPLLQKLHLRGMHNFKFDLEMLVGLPNLEELRSEGVFVTGNIRSLGILKDTLTKIVIFVHQYHDTYLQGNLMDVADFPKLQYLSLSFPQLTGDLNEMKKSAFPALETLKIINRWNVRGNLMNLSDLPHLKDLDLGCTAVTGDIRDIGNDDFPSLESLQLPPGVYGGWGFQFQSISDAPDVIAAVYILMKKRPNLQLENWFAELSDDSPYSYEAIGNEEDFDEGPQPPFKIEIVKAGSRLGWRWLDFDADGNTTQPCEINWLDPEPDKESDHYQQYIEELEAIEHLLDAYKGFHQPPTAEEYRRIHSKYEV